MTKTVLIIVAHTDDETLGAGGTIARHVADGDTVYGIAMTDGVSSRNVQDDSSMRRQKNAEKAAKVLGLHWLDHGSFPDNAMDSVPLLEIVQFIEAAKAKVKPSLVYTHCGADLNIDHRIVCQAALAAFRPQPNEICREIRSFEVASATDYGHKDVTGIFQPNLYIAIDATWAKKAEALHCYSAEMREAPHTRSYEGLANLARYRGFQVGVNMAEAFQILRKIEI